jgi:transposase InsO family protein
MTLGKLEMTNTEIDRIKILEKVMEGQWTQKRASEALKLSLRQTKRICKRYKSQGVEGLIHQGRGKPSSRRMGQETNAIVTGLIVKEEFNGFGPTLLNETLEEEHGISVSREWLRQKMVAEGRWQPNKVKKVNIHPRRKRRSRRGELIQIDGSYEDWFEDRGPRCCLLVMIDDATSEIMAMRFVEHETTRNYFEILKEYIGRYDRPLGLYSDRHSIFKISKETKAKEIRYSQFERAMKELGIEMIHARSPQAKGRVERANGTLQDRLIKKMRRLGIATMQEGNNYLEEYGREHNLKFAKLAENSENAHVELLPSMDLEKILAIKDKRKVQKNLEVQYENMVYQLELKNSARRMQGMEVNVLQQLNGKIVFEYKGKEIKHTIYQEIAMKNTILDHKELEVLPQRKKPPTMIERHRRGVACNF